MKSRINYIEDCINIAGNTTGKYESRRAIEQLADLQQNNNKMKQALLAIACSNHADEMSNQMQDMIREVTGLNKVESN